MPRAPLIAVARYMTLPLDFIADELAFDSTHDAHAFLAHHGSAFYVPPNNNHSGRDSRQLDCKSARDTLAAALANYTKVDIKQAACFFKLHA